MTPATCLKASFEEAQEPAPSLGRITVDPVPLRAGLRRSGDVKMNRALGVSVNPPAGDAWEISIPA